MPDLYTSLVHAKQVLAGGEPALTPLTEAALAYVDPSFCPGMGILDEDRDGGLKCPVRGCGKRFHNLTQHLRSHDNETGGDAARTIRQVLSLDPKAKLISGRLRRDLVEKNKGNTMPRGGRRGGAGDSAVARERRQRARKLSMGRRNLTNSCDSQIVQRVLVVRDRVRREPGEREVEHYDPALLRAVGELGWTWDDCLAWTRLSAGMSESKRGDVLMLLEAWYRSNGRLPDRVDMAVRDLAPPLPERRAIMAALKVDTWVEAMQAAAAYLGVHSGRYAA
jgi:hypothetical protein